LNENLLGLKANETRKFEIKYSKDHKNKKLAGKEIGYSIKIVTIKEKKLPDINDDFAKELGDFKSLKDLKEKIKSELKLSKENSSQRELAEEIMQKSHMALYYAANDGSAEVTSATLEAAFEEGLMAVSAGADPTKICMLLPVNTTDEELEAGFTMLEKAMRRIAEVRDLPC